MVRNKKMLRVSFGNIDVTDIEHENAGRVPDISHDLTYKHTYEYAMIDPRVAAYAARSKAIKVASGPSSGLPLGASTQC